MLYLAHALQPTSTRHALKSDLIQPGIDSLIIGKHSAIEVYAILPDRLKLIHNPKVFGLIDHIQAYKKFPNTTSTLLVLTADLHAFTLRFCPRSASIITTASISLHQIGARPADYLPTSIVDPHGRCLIIHALNGILHLLPLRPSAQAQPSLLEPVNPRRKRPALPSPARPPRSEPDSELHQLFQLRLNELNVHALAFAPLPPDRPPVLLVLYANHLGDRILRSRLLDLPAANCDTDFCPSHPCQDPATGLIIPLPHNPAQSPAAILVGEESAELIQLPDLANGEPKGKSIASNDSQLSRSALNEVLIGPQTRLPLGSYTCFCKIDDQPDSWLVGDLYGNLLHIHLDRSPAGEAINLIYDHVGHVPSPEALVYISNGFVFLASHYGDSQLLKLPATCFEQPDCDLAPTSLDVISSFPNLAPISDFCVTEDRQSAASQLVTCSGAYRDGSLRIVRHGIGLSDLGFIEIGGVQRLWALKSQSAGAGVEDFDDRLVLSFVDRTRLLAFNEDGSIEEMSHYNGFRTDLPTILAGHLSDRADSRVRYPVQFTAEQIIASDTVRWEPGQGHKVTVAAIGSSIGVVALKREVLLLMVEHGVFVQAEMIEFQNDVSSLAIDPSQKFIAVGQWVSNAVEMVCVASQARLCQIETGSEFMVSSLVMSNFGWRGSDQCRLLVGLGDGKMMNVALDGRGALVAQPARRVASLGVRPVEFVALDGGASVWANTDQASLISRAADSGRFLYTGLSLSCGDVRSVSPLATPEFGDAVVLALKEGLWISKMNKSSKMEIVKIALGGEQPRRIAHSKQMQAYGVVCVRLELDQESGELHRIGSVKILDDESFELLYDFKLLTIEQGSSIAAIELGPDRVEHFVIGTGLVRSNEPEARSGRILAIRDMNSGSSAMDVRQARDFRLTNMTRVAGAVGGLGALPEGMFVASANAFVHAFGVEGGQIVGGTGAGEQSEDGGGTFKLLDTWGGGFVSQTVVTDGRKVLVGDLYKSIVLLEFEPKQMKLVVKARDYNAMSVRPIGKISDREFVAADSDFNLFTVEHRVLEEEDGENGQGQGVTNVDQSEQEEKGEDDEWDEEEQMMAVEKVFQDDNLSHVGAFHLGENVNHFRAGSLVPRFTEESLPGRTSMIFVTSTGSIGIIGQVEDQASLLLSKLEARMRKVVKSMGNLDQVTYRMFKTKTKRIEPRGFIDGDFVQMCLELSEKDWQKIYDNGEGGGDCSGGVGQEAEGEEEDKGKGKNSGSKDETQRSESVRCIGTEGEYSHQNGKVISSSSSSLTGLRYKCWKDEVCEVLEELGRLH